MYQNDSVVTPDGTVKVWLIDESPLVGNVEPSCAAYVPACGLDVVVAVVPADVQPDRLPNSKSPFVRPPPDGAVTVSVYVVLCVAEAPVPVTVTA